MNDREKVRPLVKIMMYESDDRRVLGYKCPNCGEVFCHDLDNYCCECGQKLKEVKV